ncbi:RNA polymerase sigma factor SigM [Frankia sp. QA3]|uniref:RNA polymerase sigma factor SigM n=1 Tax=Frankia sp. QA3 TaxID=710111 RepID=UPI000269C853|nr:RNA polymerase sigma factor SigM [Frankia sp. QA3]EIV95086.1 RNA polymerase sigma factor, sigma-70 family [Frankia sp. QA3]
MAAADPSSPLPAGPPGDDRAADPDVELLRRHVAGNPDAFGKLFRRHADQLWSVAHGLLRDGDDAAGAVQEAMLSARRAAASFRGESEVGTWLHRIVTNAALERLRRQAAHPTVPPPTRAGCPRNPIDPRDTITERDICLDVDDVLGRLPLALRTAVVLVDVQRLPLADVARLLDVPAGTVKSRCSRGRAHLALLLGHLPPGNPGAPPTVSEEGHHDAAAPTQRPPDARSRSAGRSPHHAAPWRPDLPEEVISNGD